MTLPRPHRDALTAVVRSGDPRTRGKALTGRLAGLWRYRIGAYRVICDICDTRLVVVAIAIAIAIDIGKRDHVYE
ncbi:MAG: hypothetical protein LBK59_02720 [Bifidobacteriaceae bacterium]|jgi:mRNA interferase RelE/StbE|nr:hypothetical protein [Bifidobacteriaceae bacterium]